MRRHLLNALGRLGLLIAQQCLREVWHDAAEPRSEVVGSFDIGGAGADVRPFQRILPLLGFPRPFDGVVTIGGGGYGRRDRALIGGEGSGGSTKRGSRLFRTNCGYGAGVLLTGYPIYRSALPRLYPLIGIGGGGQGFAVRARGQHAKKLAPVVSGGTGGLQLRVGWGSEFRVKLLPNAGLLFGLHVGWMLSPLGLPWFTRGLAGMRLPRPRFARPYLKLLVGGFVTTSPDGA